MDAFASTIGYVVLGSAALCLGLALLGAVLLGQSNKRGARMVAEEERKQEAVFSAWANRMADEGLEQLIGEKRHPLPPKQRSARTRENT